VPTLRELGVDPDPVIRAAGLDPCLFDDGVSLLPFAALVRLYTLCVARTGCATFELRAMPEKKFLQLTGEQGSEFSDDIRRLLRTRLTSNHCSADDIAHLLRVRRCTLSRRLKGGGMGLQGNCERDPVRDRASAAAGHPSATRPDRGGARLFGSERLYPGLPALVGPDPDNVAGRRSS
jgi:hypothetical protein